MKHLIAGGTGYLGGHLLVEMRRRGLDIRAIARSIENLEAAGLETKQCVVAHVTDPESIRGICDGVDVVLSTVGITRQKDGLTYMDVDYQANRNLLDEALRSGVRKFVYVSVFNGRQLRQLKICEAKERFVDELKHSGIDYAVVRPNGFFSDMAEFIDMAKRGRIWLFGDGSAQINPIHGADLAEVCLDSIEVNAQEIDVGGPEILTLDQIAELAFATIDKQPHITHLPDWVRGLTLRAARTLTSVKTYGPLEFLLTVLSEDSVAPRFGKRRLADYFLDRAQASSLG